MNQEQRFRKYEVKADSVADFLKRFCKPERYTGRGAEYAACVLASHEKDFQDDGYTIISHHESVTGDVVAYFSTPPLPYIVGKPYVANPYGQEKRVWPILCQGETWYTADSQKEAERDVDDLNERHTRTIAASLAQGYQPVLI